MASRDTLFKFAGITVHTGGSTVRSKVRYGTDYVMRFKQLNNPKKIEDKRLGICLTPVRVDLIELPQPMAKVDALNWLLAQPNFQSPEDQALIQEEIDNRTPKAPRAKRDTQAVKVKATKKATPSLDSIKARGKNAAAAAAAAATDAADDATTASEGVAEVN